jgi:hypothetical protein
VKKVPLKVLHCLSSAWPWKMDPNRTLNPKTNWRLTFIILYTFLHTTH